MHCCDNLIRIILLKIQTPILDWIMRSYGNTFGKGRQQSLEPLCWSSWTWGSSLTCCFFSCEVESSALVWRKQNYLTFLIVLRAKVALWHLIHWSSACQQSVTNPVGHLSPLVFPKPFTFFTSPLVFRLLLSTQLKHIGSQYRLKSFLGITH